MKKLMIAAFAAVLGIAANAASVQWNVNAIQGPDDSKAKAGWLVQVYSSTVEYNYKAAAAGSLSVWDSSSTVAAGTTFRASNTKADGQSAGTSKNYYMVIYDAASVGAANHYIVSAEATCTIGDGGSTGSIGFGAMLGTSLATNKFYDSDWVAVGTPEPTSGLLLLIGMAGLALRRRRA